MRKPIIALALISGLAISILFGCGGGSSTVQPPAKLATGSLAVLGTDAPLCNVFSFTVTITGITLTPQGGGDPVSVLGANQSLTVDFARLLEFNTILNLANVPAGTYSKMTLTLSSAQLTVIDVTQTPPVPVPITTSLSNASVAINLDPALTLNEGGTASLLVDFHLFRSVLTLNGQVTGEVNPVLTVTRMSSTAEDGLGRLDDLHGVVHTVTTTSNNSSFMGSFTLQTRGGFGPVLTVNVTGNTEFEDGASLSTLKQGDFVEADAKVDTSGNIVAREVEVEGTVDAQGKAAFEGIVLYVVRDGAGKATQFTLFVREEHPDINDSIPLRSALTVNVSDATRFGMVRPGINEAGLSFDPTTLGVGQSVFAYGTYHTGTPSTLDADGAALRPQAVRGSFESLLQPVGSDGKTGGFDMVPCSALFKGQAIHVFTFADTEFYGVSDLNGLNTQTAVHAKGLLLYEPGTTTISGITVTPPSMVMEARGVHQRPVGD